MKDLENKQTDDDYKTAFTIFKQLSESVKDKIKN